MPLSSLKSSCPWPGHTRGPRELSCLSQAHAFWVAGKATWYSGHGRSGQEGTWGQVHSGSSSLDIKSPQGDPSLSPPSRA